MTANIKTIRTSVHFTIRNRYGGAIAELGTAWDLRWFMPDKNARDQGIDPVSCPRGWREMLDSIEAEYLPHFERGSTVDIWCACPMVADWS